MNSVRIKIDNTHCMQHHRLRNCTTLLKLHFSEFIIVDNPISQLSRTIVIAITLHHERAPVLLFNITDTDALKLDRVTCCQSACNIWCSMDFAYRRMAHVMPVSHHAPFRLVLLSFVSTASCRCSGDCRDRTTTPVLLLSSRPTNS